MGLEVVCLIKGEALFKKTRVNHSYSSLGWQQGARLGRMGAEQPASLPGAPRACPAEIPPWDTTKGLMSLPQGSCSSYSPITPLQTETQLQEQRLAQGPSHHCHGPKQTFADCFYIF